MNKTLPKIKETEAEIREMLKSEQQVKRQNRLQALYLIVGGQANPEVRSQKYWDSTATLSQNDLGCMKRAD
jgi:hypothetical protein